MTSLTNTFLHTLSDIAQHNDHRYGVVFNGDATWQNSAISGYLKENKTQTVFQIGGTPFDGVIHAPVKKAQQLLGRECQVLVCDFREQFDANGFSAALGALVGGGLLLVLPPDIEDTEGLVFGQRWLNMYFEKLISVFQGDGASGLERRFESLPQKSNDPKHLDRFEQQNVAIELVKKVVSGHRKRPLILIADRGRGKSSTLGIAAAQLLAERSSLNIVVTAPSVKATEPVFAHANQRLNDCKVVNAAHIHYQGGSLRFVAPDELLKSKPECDLLLVDEAAAIPIPMLKSMVDNYHRMVFSTTVHGYEGSGRGFGIKFEAWLTKHRPGWRGYKLEQPIRWKNHDPLEAWLFDCFLLGAASSNDVAERDVELLASEKLNSLSLVELSKRDCLTNPSILQQCFSLLVDAHYQTSPNDLMQFLNNPAIQLYAAWQQGECLGCMLVTQEGGLDSELISQIQIGKRRPQGHLAPVLLANQLGAVQAATSTCTRVMRIAVSTRHQGLGIGSWMLDELSQHIEQADYLATSFGATSDLIAFWRNNDFTPVHIGHQRDQASGCHSVLMVKPLNANSESWISQLVHHFERSFCFVVSGSLASLEVDMVRALLPIYSESLCELESQLIKNYVDGGNSYDSIGYSVLKLVLISNARQSQKAALDSENVTHSSVSDLLLAKVVQQKGWGSCVEQFNFIGRKQVEAQFRKDVEALLVNLQCK
ncbi:GNAT family N-acetyltransferase [Vibrio sp. Isolate31]|uniref:GNAT family N-acetyltransferase n=1 Tax=unclassified Vibrio TaxID=2614977 RepID=UPI001EFC3D5E|nr:MULTISPECIES: GNAT family N-acetyltransferase [unclassified Vibrio]MCG9553176.1 GNAT family N-acetyltransferase [Vibrio sp. Isolate32]MCG9600345.1 GNAT family N-acetyltransferase [Vibrio sp. Isolate31]